MEIKVVLWVFPLEFPVFPQFTIKAVPLTYVYEIKLYIYYILDDKE